MNKKEAEKWFYSLIEILKKDYYPHLHKQIEENNDLLKKTFKIYFENDLGVAINKTLNSIHKLELDIINSDFELLSKEDIERLINATKSELIKSKLDNEGNHNLGNILLETRLEQLELTKNKIEQNKKANNQPTGFYCELPEPTVEEIFRIMQAKDQISGNPENFKAIFSQTPQRITEPVKWLISWGDKPNKKALWTFLNLMTGITTFSSKENKEKIANCFIDKKGKTLSVNKPDKRYFSNSLNDFEEIIKMAKEKTRPV